MSKKVSRLYESFKPENYQLTVNIDRKNKKFSGSVVIKGQRTGRPSNRFTLHQKALKITSAQAVKHDKKGDEEIKVTRINTQESLHELRLHSEELIYPGEYTLSIDFNGKISDIMVGLYPCYFKKDGKEDWLIATQFESHHAREAFPCIDEPEAKATFDLTVITDKGSEVLSNTEVKLKKDQGKDQVVTFETTPVMSSYLLAWVIGDIHGVEGKTKDGVKVKSWGSAAQPKEFLKFANEEAIKILEFYEEYFDTSFPLKKLDQVALPDFEVGAMENWGLITYREAAMLADPVNRSVSAEQYIAMVVAHELSHQWFGNLVTMKWWDDLWLNESFASMVEHIALDNLHPEWHQWETFTSYDVLAASNRDNYLDVQPVSIDVNHPDEIHSIFDGAIVYAKGARLLKMLFDYIGEDAMRTSLRNYFNKYAYKNTTKADLWDEITKVSGIDINELMTPWLIKSGMPVLEVEREKDKIKVSQHRFLLDGEDDKSTWSIPLLSDVKLPVDVLKEKSKVIPYTGSTSPIFNVSGSGHYIVNYLDNVSKQNVKDKFASLEIPSVGRINALNDMLLLCRKGIVSLTDILDIVSKSSKEPRDSVWSILMLAIGKASLLTDGDKEIEDKIKKLKIELSDYWFSQLGWDDKPEDDPNTKLLRQTALGLKAAGEDPEVIKTALKKFEAAENTAVLNSDQRALISGAAVKFSDNKNKVVEQLMKEYEDSPNPEVQHSIASALCSTREKDIADKIIDWGLKEKGAVRAQDLTRWYIALIRNRHIREAAWEWLKKSWDERYEELGGPKTLPYFIRYTSQTITTEERYREFKEFFDPKLSNTGLSRDIKVAYSMIESQIEWRKREEPKLKKYFSA